MVCTNKMFMPDILQGRNIPMALVAGPMRTKTATNFVTENTTKYCEKAEGIPYFGFSNNPLQKRNAGVNTALVAAKPGNFEPDQELRRFAMNNPAYCAAVLPGVSYRRIQETLQMIHPHVVNWSDQVISQGVLACVAGELELAIQGTAFYSALATALAFLFINAGLAAEHIDVTPLIVGIQTAIMAGVTFSATALDDFQYNLEKNGPLASRAMAYLGLSGIFSGIWYCVCNGMDHAGRPSFSATTAMAIAFAALIGPPVLAGLVQLIDYPRKIALLPELGPAFLPEKIKDTFAKNPELLVEYWSHRIVVCERYLARLRNIIKAKDLSGSQRNSTQAEIGMLEKQLCELERKLAQVRQGLLDAERQKAAEQAAKDAELQEKAALYTAAQKEIE